LWELATGRFVARRPVPFASRFFRHEFPADGEALALLVDPRTAERDQTPLAVHVWEAAADWKGRTLVSLAGEWTTPEMSDTGLAFSTDGERLAVGQGRRVWVCDSATGDVLHTLADTAATYTPSASRRRQAAVRGSQFRGGRGG